jgi:hypothetical protein
MASTAVKPVVIKISPMAHIAVGFFALNLLMVASAWPWTAPLLLIPVAASVLIVRLRTIAGHDTVTARTLLDSTTMRWDDIDGLRFVKSSWATAHLKTGGDVRLPGVTFAMLPLLTEASGGRVPNPYR